MPIYEYRCGSCGQTREALQRMSDPPLTECQECGGPLEKLISSPAFQFKGSGWYVTDYARKDGATGGGSDNDGGEPEKSGDSSAATEGKSSSSKASGDAGKADGKASAPAAGSSRD